MNKNYIGENIRIYRERKNITQRELADRIGKTWEMVSRYERGVSSPLKQIENIASVLNIEVADLLKDSTKNTASFSFNRIPLFDFLPKDLDFKNTKSYVYYVAPDWILSIDEESFVIDTKLVDSNLEDLKKNGYLYISPKSEIKYDDIVLIKKDDGVIVKKYKEDDSGNVIGKVLAQEIIF
jgi:transcriptional regulator with XRE-family HTH domain